MNLKKYKFCGSLVCLLLTFFYGRGPASVLTSGGIGVPVWNAGARFMGMGGVSIPQADPYTLSAINPASRHLIRLTRLSLEYAADVNRYRDDSGSSESPYSNFNGFTFAIPAGRGFGLAFGMAPYTRTDFRFSFYGALDGETYYKTVTSDGGLNKTDFSLVYDYKSKVGIGLAANYFFGKITETWKVIYNGANFTQTKEQMTTKSWGYGLTAGFVVHPSGTLSIGGVYRPAFRIDTNTERYDTPLSETLTENPGNFKLPAFWGMGVQYRHPKGVVIGSEYSEEAWNKLSVNGRSVSSLRKNVRLSFGAEMLLGELPTDSFFKRMAYRIGGSLRRFYMSDANGDAVREITGTVGFGFPLISPASRVDVAFGFGRRGSLSANGFTENFYTIGVSAALAEKWFSKN
jgi:hypothetical protein